MKHKRWLNVEPLYVIHVLLIGVLVVLASMVAGMVGLQSIANRLWWFVANALWYAVILYLFDITYHHFIGGD